jgi:hypothetical protein
MTKVVAVSTNNMMDECQRKLTTSVKNCFAAFNALNEHLPESFQRVFRRQDMVLFVIFQFMSMMWQNRQDMQNREVGRAQENDEKLQKIVEVIIKRAFENNPRSTTCDRENGERTPKQRDFQQNTEGNLVEK